MKPVFFISIFCILVNICLAQAVIDSGSTIMPIIEEEESHVFTKTEISPQFPGGQTSWNKYKQKSLGTFNPKDYGAPKGSYQVIIRFIVRKDGSIYDTQAETKFGFEMEEIAIKIIQQGPKWIPALQNGHNVNCYYRQAITFKVE